MTLKNEIGDDGVYSLSSALKNNSSLTLLYLGLFSIKDTHHYKDVPLYNKIGMKGASLLSSALKANSTLTLLYLGLLFNYIIPIHHSLFNNNIGGSGAYCLAEALKVNSSLSRLNLESSYYYSFFSFCVYILFVITLVIQEHLL